MSAVSVYTSNGQISKEEPARDEGLFGGAGGFAHDVQVRRVEAQCGGRQTVSHEVDPKKLDGDQSLRKTECSSQEDTEEVEKTPEFNLSPSFKFFLIQDKNSS